MAKKLIHTPEGVRDIYGIELKNKLDAEAKLMQVFHQFGYKSIQTPTFEFFDVFSKDIGTTKSNELYKFFDKEGNTLVLRPDFTPSMARCAAKYFMDEDIPVRFSYVGHTFTNTSELQGKLKEVTQTGIELIGDSSKAADAELLHMAVSALKNVGLTQFQISIGEVEFIKGLCEEAGLDNETELQLRDLISDKNYFGIEEFLMEAGLDKDKVNSFLKVTELFGGVECLEEAEELVSNKRSLQAVKRLKNVYKILKERGDEKYISFDLGMVSKYNYYTGIIFKAYTYGVGDAILKGGRYDSLLASFGKEAAAIGFMIVVDDLMVAMNSQKLNSKQSAYITYLLYDEPVMMDGLKLADHLREKGHCVECVRFSHDKTMDDYVAYGNQNMVAKIYHLTSEQKILIYDLTDDSPDALPVDNFELSALMAE